MRNIRLALLLLAGILPQVISYASDADTVMLQTNPFLRPTNEQINSGNSNSTSNKTPAGSMRLRGIMRANSNSVANIDGEIISIGQQIQGYTLISIQQRHIVLDRNGTQVTLSIDNETGGND
jgi:hypothetical protein